MAADRVLLLYFTFSVILDFPRDDELDDLEMRLERFLSKRLEGAVLMWPINKL